MLIKEHFMEHAMSLLSSDYASIEEERNAMLAACAFANLAMAVELKRANDMQQEDREYHDYLVNQGFKEE